MVRSLPKKAHSARNNNAFTHCGISLISPNTLHKKYSGSLKCFMFSLIFISLGKQHPLWSHFQENDPYTIIINSIKHLSNCQSPQFGLDLQNRVSPKCAVLVMSTAHFLATVTGDLHPQGLDTETVLSPVFKVSFYLNVNFTVRFSACALHYFSLFQHVQP